MKLKYFNERSMNMNLESRTVYMKVSNFFNLK